MLLYPPTGDLYRHWMTFQEISQFDWNDFLFFLSLNFKIDFLLFLLEFIFIQGDISFGFIRYLLVFIATLLYLQLYDDFCEEESFSGANRIFFLCFVICIIPYSGIAIGLRSSFASTLFSIYICKRYLLNQKSFWNHFLLILAVYFHFGTLMAVPLLILAKCGMFIRRKSLFYIVFITLFLISQSFGTLLALIPLGDLGSYLSTYTEDEYASTGYLSGFNIFFWIPTICYYIANILFIVLFCKNVPITKNTSLVYNLFLLFAFTSSFFAISGRVMAYFYLYGIFFLIRYAGLDKLKQLFRIYVFFILFGFILHWRKYSVTRWNYLFSPFPIALCMDYDDDWVMENVDGYGNLYIYLK